MVRLTCLADIEGLLVTLRCDRRDRYAVCTELDTLQINGVCGKYVPGIIGFIQLCSVADPVAREASGCVLGQAVVGLHQLVQE